jgi:hypothetical protein
MVSFPESDESIFPKAKHRQNAETNTGLLHISCSKDINRTPGFFVINQCSHMPPVALACPDRAVQ